MSYLKNIKHLLNSSEEGLTLVVLVITIIVMLILASIVLSSGDIELTNMTKTTVKDYEEYKNVERNQAKELITGLKNKDTIMPDLIIFPSTTKWTRDNVSVFTNIKNKPDDYDIYMRKGDNGDWINKQETVVSAADYTGPVNVYAALGKRGEEFEPEHEVHILINNIDVIKPSNTAPSETHTKTSITAVCKQTDEESGIDKDKIVYGIRKLGEDDDAWAWQNNNKFTDIEEGESYEVKTKAVDKVGNEEESEVTIIDKTAPQITASNITYGQSLDITLEDSQSGIKGWQVTNSNTEPSSGWTEITPSAEITVTKTGLAAGKWYIWAKDTVGNINSKEITVSKATPTLTLSATSGTIVAGNSTTFTITYTGDGSLSAESSSTEKATATLSNETVTVKGVAAGSSTITVSASEGTNYVAASKTYTATVQAALYEVSNVATGKLKYHITLANAVNASNAGATIKVLANTSNEGATTISKNITINTQSYTLTRTGTLTVSAGTTTISGTGGITRTAGGAGITVSNSAILKTSGTPLIKSKGSAVNTTGSARLQLAGGYCWSTEYLGIHIDSSGANSITNTKVFTSSQYKNSLGVSPESTGALTLTNSWVGNGTTATTATGTDNSYALWYGSTGKLTITGTSRIYSGPYGNGGIYCENKCTVELLKSSSIYANCKENHVLCLFMNTTGSKVTFNSTGYFYSAGTYSFRAGNSSNNIVKTTLAVTKGYFGSRNDGYMMFNNGNAVSAYKAADSTKKSRLFYYMKDYKTQSAANAIADVYYLAVGF